MAGKIVHVELPAKDGNRARKFYRTIFGWKFGESGMPDMDYHMTEGVEPVVAVYTAPDQKGPVIYFDVDDIDTAVRQIRTEGGKAEEKMPIPGQGYFASCVDTEGNPFSLFQSDPSATMPEEQSQATASTRA
jgi:predicted enzyme related to lactoylglutathione lyase